LEHSVNGGLGGHFFDEHGMKLAYDPQLPKDHRIIFALVQDRSGNWQQINQTAKYKIATNDYSFDGGEGYDFKSATNIVRKPEKMMVALSDYLKKHPKITPNPPDRIVAINSSILSADRKDGDATLHVRNAEPDSRLIFVAGTDKGVEPIEGKTPVPLKHPHVVQRAKCDSDGHYDWTVPLATLLPQQKNSRDNVYAAVIVMPPRTAANKHALVSYPISLR
jgi:hypothetical protein